MQQLQFVELDEGGRLVVSDEDGTRYAVPVDDRLRAALRPRPKASSPERGGSGVSPREVQSMIRAGQSADEVAAVTGWEVERVRRFEGPVLAEREHVVGLAQRAPVRAQGRTDGSHTLERRVRERLQGRDVDLQELSWDAARTAAAGPWTVQVIFLAGGRERRAAWHYEVATRALESLDDEARWLSEDEQALPGGLAGHPLLGGGHGEDEAAAELMATMRERRQRRRRTRKEGAEAGAENGAAALAGHVPGQQAMPPEVLPLEDLHYDPDTMGDPPAAHSRADDAPGEQEAAEQDGAEQEGAEQEGAEQEGAEPTTPEPVTQEPADQRGDQEAADQEGADREPAARSGRAKERPSRQRPTKERPAKERRPRRRLRMPKLPAPVDLPVDDPGSEPEVHYARTHHPDEVSFDEFFGTDEEEEFEDEEFEDEEFEDAELDEEEYEEYGDAEPGDAALGDLDDLDDDELVGFDAEVEALEEDEVEAPGDDEGDPDGDFEDHGAQAEHDGETEDQGAQTELDEQVEDEGTQAELDEQVDEGELDEGELDEELDEELEAELAGQAPPDEDQPEAPEPSTKSPEPSTGGPEQSAKDSARLDEAGNEDSDTDAPGADTPGADAPGANEPDADAAADAAAGDAPDLQGPAAEATEAKPRQGSRRKGRTSVPSWDDIMFGARDRG